MSLALGADDKQFIFYDEALAATNNKNRSDRDVFKSNRCGQSLRKCIQCEL